MKKQNLILLIINIFSLLIGTIGAQNVRKVEIFGPAIGNAVSGEVAVVYNTGLIYNTGQSAFGGNIGVIDPNTKQLIKVIRPANLNSPASMFFSRVNQATNLVYFLQSTTPGRIVVVDGRPLSPTFNQLLPELVFDIQTVLSNQTISAFAIDQTRNRLYVTTRVVGSNPIQSQVHTIDVDPASAMFHQILSTVSLPAGQAVGHLAVNTVTNKTYIASSLAGGGIFVLNNTTNSLTKIASTIQTALIAVNENSNTIYASNFTPSIQTIDGVNDTFTGSIGIQSPIVVAFGENFTVNSVSERVFAIMNNGSLAVIDAKRTSPAFNTVLANIPNVGSPGGAVDIHEGLNKIIVASGNSTKTSIIDGGTNTVVSTTEGNFSSLDVAVNPLTNQAYVGITFYTTQIINLNDNSYTNIGTVGELSQGIVNPNNNLFYFGRSSSIADIAYLDPSDNIGQVNGELNEFGRFLYTAHNPVTNRIYVANTGATTATSSGYISVIDGAANHVIANVEGIRQPFGHPAVNEVTNKIYVYDVGGGGQPSKITVINGATNIASTVNTSAFPINTLFAGVGNGMAVNPVTNRIYFQVGQFASAGVIDGNTDIAVPLPGITNFSDIQVNPNLNRVYFLTSTGIIVFNGANDMEIANIQLPLASSLVINKTTGRIYVRNNVDQLTVIDGNTNQVISTISSISGNSFSMAVNETTNELVVGTSTNLNDESSSAVLFINGDTLAVRKTLPIPLRPGRIAINPVLKTVYATTTNASQRTGIVVISDYTVSTAAGQNVAVMPSNGVTLTFEDVTMAGNTNITTLSPSDVPPLPPNFSLVGSSLMFNITTSAVFSGNIVVTFNVPNVSSASDCSQLRILHYVNNDWDVTGNSVPIYNEGSQTCTVSQTVASLSPFVVAQSNPPTNIEQCKNNGWKNFDFPRRFNNQGDCIKYVNTGK